MHRGLNVFILEGIAICAGLVALWRIGSALLNLADAAGIIAHEARLIRVIAEDDCGE